MADTWKRTITFDRFIRWFLIALLVVGIVLLLRRLSGVLMPFFIAWLLAWLMNPLVNFFQYRCRFRYRLIAVLAAFAVVGLALWGIFELIVPPIWNEIMTVKDMLVNYLQKDHASGGLSSLIHSYLGEQMDPDQLKRIFTADNLLDALKESMPKIWKFLTGSFQAFSGIVSLGMVLLYLLFILIDYDKLSRGVRYLIPKRYAPTFTKVMNDLSSGMNKYFRGQALISLCVAILFCTGFLIIGFPMAVALGIFIGILSLVPYLHIAGFIPITILAAVESAQTDKSFGMLMLSAATVFLVVQVIEDAILTPKIMGKVSGLYSAIILLSLSVWGSLLGLIGMIIAIPVTTLLVTYYQRYVVKIPATPATHSGAPDEIPEDTGPFDNPDDPDDLPYDVDKK